MPLQLLPYDSIAPHGIGLYDFYKNEYSIFGAKIIAILNQKSSEKKIAECTFMANMRVMSLLLGPEFAVESLHFGKKFPKQKLQSKIARKRKTCVIEGVTRFLIVHEITISK